MLATFHSKSSGFELILVLKNDFFTHTVEWYEKQNQTMVAF